MRYISLFICLLALLSSCIGVAPTQEIQQVNALNDMVYQQKYRSLKQVYEYALQAYNLSENYVEGRAESCNNLGFYYFMKMNFNKSSDYFKEAQHTTQNQLDLLISDIGMMKIAQRTAQNKLFYDYKNSALKRMKQIKEDQTVFDSIRDKMKLNYAFSEFYIVSIIYYYYLQQLDSAREVVKLMDEYEKNSYLYDVNKTDLTQLLYYKYIEASTGLIEGESRQQRLLNSFDQLAWIYKMALEYGLVYFQANALQAIANLMVEPKVYNYLMVERSHTFSTFKIPINGDFALKLGEEALDLFKYYDDLYQTASVYVTLAKIDNYRGNFKKALKWLVDALDCVNEQHKIYYEEHHDEVDVLELYGEIDEFPVELLWVEDGVLTVPDWIGRIREQLSVTYAGLNNKLASDYNRNIYLDLLDLVRQDKESESRLSILQEEEQLVNRILILLFVFLLVVSIGFYFLNKRARKRTFDYLEILKRSLNIGQELTASLPIEAVKVEDILSPIIDIITPFLSQEFNVSVFILQIDMEDQDEEVVSYSHGGNSEDVSSKYKYAYCFNLLVDEAILKAGKLEIFSDKKLTTEQTSLINLLIPSITWAIENGVYFITLGDEIEVLDKKLYIINQHNTSNRQENIDKRACMRVVYGIQPYIDRVRNEIEKLATSSYAQQEDVKKYKLKYIEELIETIDNYNKVLSQWIKIKQGYLSLQISNFPLLELFDLVRKSSRYFEQKGLELLVHTTTSNVKADKALTLFMINTLLENARKYTPSGGKVVLEAVEEPDYVEVSVTDTGVGLSEQEIALIMKEKIYDSSIIGQDIQFVKESKGSGFGLMNCKAIIEKYKKTNPVFNVCAFNIKSEKGVGSKFSIRLPYGVKKIGLIVVMVVSMFGFSSCNNIEKELPIHTADYELIPQDSTQVALAKLADQAFYANTVGKYDVALSYIDSAMQMVNNAYSLVTSPDIYYMNLNGEGVAAEIRWFAHRVNLNYYILLDLRNEAAVASLALHKLNQYNYNNEAYATLYKLISKDDTLDYYCKILQQSTSNKRVALILLLIAILTVLFIYYFVYLKRRYMRRWSLEQVLEIYARIFSSSLGYMQRRLEDVGEDNLAYIPQQILENSFTKLNNLISLDWLTIAFYNTDKGEFIYTSYPSGEVKLDRKIVGKTFNKGKVIKEKNIQYIPLVVDLKESSLTVGVLALRRRIQSTSLEDDLYLQLVVKYLSTVLYNAMVRTAGRFKEIEFVQNDVGRIEWENNQIHIQNKILDNCLSAIKHETIYYPSRIRQLVEDTTLGTKSLDIKSIKDLVDYYYGVFTMLSLWAKKELEKTTFRRSTIHINELSDYAIDLFEKKIKRAKVKGLSFNVAETDHELNMLGDIKLLQYLIELLLIDAISLDKEGELSLSFEDDVEFIHCSFTDNRVNFSNLELEQLFYPNLTWIQAEKQKGVSGQTFLIAKEIIREHDEYIGRRGCKIKAYPLEKGYKLVFSIVKK